jgi:hypothetical protein
MYFILGKSCPRKDKRGVNQREVLLNKLIGGERLAKESLIH